MYGKTPAELHVLVEGFSWVLAEHKMPVILAAMREYVSNNSDIPAPADILKIIKEMQKPKVAEEPIEVLQRYRDKGIPLTEQQKSRLEAAGVTAQ